ncbi:MAG: PilZ domain-containing protein [Deltaproteobacteria bacterium]|nr:PilZ domain-containing protein [Deltaproteobacteria bacterium]
MLRAPFPLMFIRFPQEVESSKLRKNERYPVRINAICSDTPLNGDLTDHPLDMIMNISAGGCQVETLETHPKEAIVYLSIFLPEVGLVNDVEVEVKRIDYKADKYLLGLAFADMIAENYQTVRNFISTLEAFQVRA